MQLIIIGRINKLTIFIDTANVDEIKKWIKDYGTVKGVTTNQKIFLKEKGVNFKQRIAEICKTAHPYPVSIELTKTYLSDKDLIAEAEEYNSINSNVVIKVPMWGNGRGLRIAKQLIDVNVKVNMTCQMAFEQAILSAELGCTYISLFYNRIRDAGMNACETVKQTRRFLEQQHFKSEIIAGSIRHPQDVGDAFLCGVHIVTIPSHILEQMPFHPKTEDTIKEFDNAWKEMEERI